MSWIWKEQGFIEQVCNEFLSFNLGSVIPASLLSPSSSLNSSLNYMVRIINKTLEKNGNLINADVYKSILKSKEVISTTDSILWQHLQDAVNSASSGNYSLLYGFIFSMINRVRDLHEDEWILVPGGVLLSENTPVEQLCYAIHKCRGSGTYIFCVINTGGLGLKYHSYKVNKGTKLGNIQRDATLVLKDVKPDSLLHSSFWFMLYRLLYVPSSHNYEILYSVLLPFLNNKSVLLNWKIENLKMVKPTINTNHVVPEDGNKKLLIEAFTQLHESHESKQVKSESARSLSLELNSNLGGVWNDVPVNKYKPSMMLDSITALVEVILLQNGVNEEDINLVFIMLQLSTCLLIYDDMCKLTPKDGPSHLGHRSTVMFIQLSCKKLSMMAAESLLTESNKSKLIDIDEDSLTIELASHLSNNIYITSSNNETSENMVNATGAINNKKELYSLICYLVNSINKKLTEIIPNQLLGMGNGSCTMDRKMCTIGNNFGLNFEFDNFGKFRLDGANVNELAKGTVKSLLLLPVELTDVDCPVRDYTDVCKVLRKCIQTCTILSNQRDAMPYTYAWRYQLIKHVILDLLPIPLPHKVEKKSNVSNTTNLVIQTNTSNDSGTPNSQGSNVISQVQNTTSSTNNFNTNSISSNTSNMNTSTGTSNTNSPTNKDNQHEYKVDFWNSMEILRETQLDLLRLLQLLARHLCSVFCSLVKTRQIEGEKAILLAAICSVTDAVVRKVAIDTPSYLSLFYSGQSDGPIGTFGFFLGNFANESSFNGLTDPMLVIVRNKVLEYFKSLEATVDKYNVLFNWEHNMEISKGDELLLQLLSLQLGFNRNVEDIRKYYVSESSEFSCVFPEFANLRDVVFLAKSIGWSQNSISLSRYSLEDSTLKYSLNNSSSSSGCSISVKVFGKSLKVSSLVTGNKKGVNVNYYRKMMKWFSGSSGSKNITSAADPHNLTDIEINNETDVLHLSTFPDYGGKLGRRDSEILLQYLTASYVRIPLVTQFFSDEANLQALVSDELQKVVVASIFEPGTWQSSTIGFKLPQTAPVQSRDVLSTSLGLLYNEIINAPNCLLSSIEQMLDLTLQRDHQVYTGESSKLLLFITRLTVYISNYIKIIVEYNLKQYSSNTNNNTLGNSNVSNVNTSTNTSSGSYTGNSSSNNVDVKVLYDNLYYVPEIVVDSQNLRELQTFQSRINKLLRESAKVLTKRAVKAEMANEHNTAASAMAHVALIYNYLILYKNKNPGGPNTRLNLVKDSPRVGDNYGSGSGNNSSSTTFNVGTPGSSTTNSPREEGEDLYIKLASCIFFVFVHHQFNVEHYIGYDGELEEDPLCLPDMEMFNIMQTSRNLLLDYFRNARDVSGKMDMLVKVVSQLSSTKNTKQESPRTTTEDDLWQEIFTPSPSGRFTKASAAQKALIQLANTTDEIELDDVLLESFYVDEEFDDLTPGNWGFDSQVTTGIKEESPTSSQSPKEDKEKHDKGLVENTKHQVISKTNKAIKQSKSLGKKMYRKLKKKSKAVDQVTPLDKYETWLKMKVMQHCDIEINFQTAEFSLKKNKLQLLGHWVNQYDHFVDIFGKVTNKTTIQSATVQLHKNRHWLRLTGRDYDLIKWEPTEQQYQLSNKTSFKYNKPPKGLEWVTNVLEPFVTQYASKWNFYIDRDLSGQGQSPVSNTSSSDNFYDDFDYVDEESIDSVRLYVQYTTDVFVASSNYNIVPTGSGNTDVRVDQFYQSNMSKMLDYTPTYVPQAHEGLIRLATDTFSTISNVITDTASTITKLAGTSSSKSKDKDKDKEKESKESDKKDKSSSKDKTVKNKQINKEVYVTRSPPCIYVFDIVEVGRTWHRSLCYCSDVTMSFCSVIPRYITNTSSGSTSSISSSKRCNIVLGDPTDLSNTSNDSSLLIIRHIVHSSTSSSRELMNRNELNGSENVKQVSKSYVEYEMLVLPKLLYGLLPQVLLEDYQFWQNLKTSDLVGYPVSGSLTSGSGSTSGSNYTGVGTSSSSNVGNTNSTNTGGSGTVTDLESLESRLVGEHGRNEELSRFWESAQDVTKKNYILVELVNLGPVDTGYFQQSEARALVSRRNKVTDEVYYLVNLQNTKDSTIKDFVTTLTRLDDLSHVLAWSLQVASYTHDSSPPKIDLIEYSKLGLTFRLDSTKSNSNRYICDEYNGLYLNYGDVNSSPLTSNLIRGLENSLLLSDDDGELYILVSTVRCPMRIYPNVPNSLVAATTIYNYLLGLGWPELVYDGHNSAWLNNLDSRHYLYKVHTSRCFLFVPTSSSLLYLLMCRFLDRQYEQVCRLSSNMIFDQVQNDESILYWSIISRIDSSRDKHPDAYASRLHILLAANKQGITISKGINILTVSTNKFKKGLSTFKSIFSGHSKSTSNTNSPTNKDSVSYKDFGSSKDSSSSTVGSSTYTGTTSSSSSRVGDDDKIFINWLLHEELCNYISLNRFVSAGCKLSIEEELELLSLCQSYFSSTPVLSNRYYLLNTLKGSGNSLMREYVVSSDVEFSLPSRPTVTNFDEVVDRSVIDKNLVIDAATSFTTMRYKKPQEMQSGPNSLEYVDKLLHKGMSMSEFMTVYELLLGVFPLSTFPNESTHGWGVILTRVISYKEKGSKNMMMSTLKVLCSNPSLAVHMPPCPEDLSKKKQFTSMFTRAHQPVHKFMGDLQRVFSKLEEGKEINWDSTSRSVSRMDYVIKVDPIVPKGTLTTPWMFRSYTSDYGRNQFVMKPSTIKSVTISKELLKDMSNQLISDSLLKDIYHSSTNSSNKTNDDPYGFDQNKKFPIDLDKHWIMKYDVCKKYLERLKLEYQRYLEQQEQQLVQMSDYVGFDEQTIDKTLKGDKEQLAKGVSQLTSLKERLLNLFKSDGQFIETSIKTVLQQANSITPGTFTKWVGNKDMFDELDENNNMSSNTLGNSNVGNMNTSGNINKNKNNMSYEFNDENNKESNKFSDKLSDKFQNIQNMGDKMNKLISGSNIKTLVNTTIKQGFNTNIGLNLKNTIKSMKGTGEELFPTLDYNDGNLAWSFVFGKLAGMENMITFEHLVECLVSSKGDHSLRYLNPFVSDTNEIFSLVAAIMLTVNRRIHVAKCISLLLSILQAIKRFYNLLSSSISNYSSSVNDSYGTSGSTTVTSGVHGTSGSGVGNYTGSGTSGNSSYSTREDEVNLLKCEIITSSKLLSEKLKVSRHYIKYDSNVGIQFDPRLLLFEFNCGILLYKRQVELVENFMKNARNNNSCCHQMIMGEGKTTVVGPLLSLLLADGEKLFVQVCPNSLLEFTRATLRETFSAVIKKNVYTFKFTRFDKATPELYLKLLQAKQTRSVVIATPTSIKSLFLKVLYCFHKLESGELKQDVVKRVNNFHKKLVSIWNMTSTKVVDLAHSATTSKDKSKKSKEKEKESKESDKKDKSSSKDSDKKDKSVVGTSNNDYVYHRDVQLELDMCLRILELFNNAVLLMDEIDLLLHPLKSELHWPMGEKVPISHLNNSDFQIRWLLPWHILRVLYPNPEQQIAKGEGVIYARIRACIEEAVVNSYLSNFPHIILLSAKWYQNELLPLMVEWVYQFLRTKNLLVENYNEVYQYIVNKNVSSNLKTVKVLVFAKDWLCSIFPHVIAKVNQVNYGILSMKQIEEGLSYNPNMPQTRKMLAVPFVGKGTPARDSEFSHPDVLIGFTILSTIYQGLRFSDFVLTIRHLCANFYQEPGKTEFRPSYKLFNKWLNSVGYHSTQSSNEKNSKNSYHYIKYLDGSSGRNDLVDKSVPESSTSGSKEQSAQGSNVVSQVQTTSSSSSNTNNNNNKTDGALEDLFHEPKDSVPTVTGDTSQPNEAKVTVNANAPGGKASLTPPATVTVTKKTVEGQGSGPGQTATVEFKVTVDKEQNKNQQNKENLEYMEEVVAEFESDRIWCLDGINVFDNEQLSVLYHILKNSTLVIEYYLCRVLFPLAMEYCEMQMTATAQELGSSILFPTRLGFSGTPSDLLPVEMNGCNFSPGVDGKMIAVTTDETIVSGPVLLPVGWDSDSIINLVANSPNKPLALIDTGALITNYTNYEVARLLLVRGLKHVDGVVFLDDDDRQMILLRNKWNVTLLAHCGIPLQKRFSFYDQIHATGQDIKQAARAIAYVTIGPDMTFRDFAQGSWRMRGIGQGQTIKIIQPPEINQQITSLTNNKGVLGCICWLLIRGLLNEVRLGRLLIEQCVENIARKKSFLALIQDHLNIGGNVHLGAHVQLFREFRDFSIPNTFAPKTTLNRRILDFSARHQISHNQLHSITSFLNQQDIKDDFVPSNYSNAFDFSQNKTNNTNPSYTLSGHMGSRTSNINQMNAPKVTNLATVRSTHDLFALSDDEDVFETPDFMDKSSVNQGSSRDVKDYLGMEISIDDEFSMEAEHEQEMEVLEQEEEATQMREQMKEEEHITEEELPAPHSYSRSDEDLVYWPLDSLVDCNTQLEFLRCRDFYLYRKDGYKYTLPFPEYLMISPNFYKIRWSAHTYRRMKNVLVVVDVYNDQSNYISSQILGGTSQFNAPGPNYYPNQYGNQMVNGTTSMSTSNNNNQNNYRPPMQFNQQPGSRVSNTSGSSFTGSGTSTSNTGSTSGIPPNFVYDIMKGYDALDYKYSSKTRDSSNSGSVVDMDSCLSILHAVDPEGPDEWELISELVSSNLNKYRMENKTNMVGVNDFLNCLKQLYSVDPTRRYIVVTLAEAEAIRAWLHKNRLTGTKIALRHLAAKFQPFDSSAVYAPKYFDKLQCLVGLQSRVVNSCLRFFNSEIQFSEAQISILSNLFKNVNPHDRLMFYQNMRETRLVVQNIKVALSCCELLGKIFSTNNIDDFVMRLLSLKFQHIMDHKGGPSSLLSALKCDKLSYSQMEKILNSNPQKPLSKNGELKAFFTLVDVDCDGVISLEDLQNIYEEPTKPSLLKIISSVQFNLVKYKQIRLVAYCNNLLSFTAKRLTHVKSETVVVSQYFVVTNFDSKGFVGSYNGDLNNSDTSFGSNSSNNENNNKENNSAYTLSGHMGSLNFDNVYVNVLMLIRGNGIDLFTKLPLKFNMVWKDQSDPNMVLWEPEPPSGYSSLGLVATTGNQPPKTSIYCLPSKWLENVEKYDSFFLEGLDSNNNVVKLSVYLYCGVLSLHKPRRIMYDNFALQQDFFDDTNIPAILSL